MTEGIGDRERKERGREGDPRQTIRHFLALLSVTIAGAVVMVSERGAIFESRQPRTTLSMDFMVPIGLRVIIDVIHCHNKYL